MFLRLILFLFLLSSCTGEVHVEMKEYKHFKYAHMLSQVGSAPGHFIYLQGFEYGADEVELQNLALHYASEISEVQKLPMILIFVNKKVFSGKHMRGDYRIANLYLNSYNDSISIKSVTLFKDGKFDLKYYPSPIDKKVEIKRPQDGG